MCLEVAVVLCSLHRCRYSRIELTTEVHQKFQHSRSLQATDLVADMRAEVSGAHKCGCKGSGRGTVVQMPYWQAQRLL